MSDQYDDGFHDGSESRQIEIDELKKRIKVIQKTAQRIMVSIDDGELDYARRSAIKIFKGEN